MCKKIEIAYSGTGKIQKIIKKIKFMLQKILKTG